MNKTIIEKGEELIKEESYFDMFGNEIQEGDLLKVWHFREAHRRRKHYMYHVATLEDFKGKLWKRIMDRKTN